MAYKKQTTSAFTIVELLVVIVVIGILAAITIVSYTGISSRATVASMQSDLSNASNLLKLDQVSSGDFPTSLTLANNGKGITPNPSLDDYKYIPDNTSNPKNFCLQYREGTNTYAIDNNSAVSKGVCLSNLVTNGDFRNGTSGWSTNGNAVLSALNSTLSITGNGVGSAVRADRDTGIPLVLAHKIYAKAKLKVTNTLSSYAFFRLRDSAFLLLGTFYSTSTPIANTAYDVSGVVTIPGAFSGNIVMSVQHDYADAATANGKVMEVQHALAVDLTTSFGAGNEPTKAQMDTIMNGYTNDWFNIVAKANL